MKILPPSARIPVKCGGYTFHLAPLSRAGKIELASLIQRHGGETYQPGVEYAYKMLQLSLKKLEGAKNFDDSDFVLEIDEKGHVTDESMDAVSQIVESVTVAAAAVKFLSDYQDPKIDGVEIKVSDIYLENSQKKVSSPEQG